VHASVCLQEINKVRKAAVEAANRSLCALSSLGSTQPCAWQGGLPAGWADMRTPASVRAKGAFMELQWEEVVAAP